MIAEPFTSLEQRANHWKEQLAQGEVIDGLSAVGGGSLPGETIPTRLLALKVSGTNAFLKRLREQKPPIIARLEDDRVVLDPRTVLPEQEDTLIHGIKAALVG
jgi:L-seryl-tRNA(Ser) seleniumtransferase